LNLRASNVGPPPPLVGVSDLRVLPVLPLVVVSVAAFVACAPAAPECGARRTADVPPEAPGPFLAGLRTWDLSYDAPGGVGPRTIKAYAWYPTLDPDARSRRSFTPPGTPRQRRYTRSSRQ
jgi:hypothetical protein